MAKWIILAVIVVLVGLFGITYLYDNSLRAGILLLGELSLKDSYKHYLEHGQPTNYASSYQVNLVTNVVSIDGTKFHCILELQSSRFRGQGVLSMTTNETFIWRDTSGRAKIIPPHYRPPLFPPSF
jgi:hypothetical protein